VALSAPSEQGLGQYQTTVPLTLSVPVSAFTGAYTATLALTLQ